MSSVALPTARAAEVPTPAYFPNVALKAWDESVRYNPNNNILLSIGARVVTIPAYNVLAGLTVVEVVGRLSIGLITGIFYAGFKACGQSNAFTNFYDREVNPFNTKSALWDCEFGLAAVILVIMSIAQVVICSCNPSSSSASSAADAPRSVEKELSVTIGETTITLTAIMDETATSAADGTEKFPYTTTPVTAAVYDQLKALDVASSEGSSSSGATATTVERKPFTIQVEGVYYQIITV